MDNTFESANRVYGTDGLSPTINTCGGGGLQPKIVEVQKVDLEYQSSETRRGRVIENGKICPTLTTENIPSVIELGNPDFYNFLYEIDGDIYLIRIRKLVPLECWRLMGFSDDDFNKASEVNSNTQLYKQAGNSIVKQVLMAIMSQLNIKGVTPWNELSVEERSSLSGKIKNQTSDK